MLKWIKPHDFCFIHIKLEVINATLLKKGSTDLTAELGTHLTFKQDISEAGRYHPRI